METRNVATVFGGSGFLGRYVVKRLAEAGYVVRVAVRDDVSRADHAHAAADPAVEGSRLYFANVPDPNLRAPCKCHLQFAEGVGWNSYQWTAVPGLSTWQHNYTGAIAGSVTGGGSLPLLAGDRVAIVFDAATMTSLSDSSPYLGAYEVVEVGGPSVQAVIRRTADANTPDGLNHGTVFEVDNQPIGGGSIDYFTVTTANPITVDTTPLSLSLSSTYTPATSDDLLTAAQLVSEGASSGVFFASVAASLGHSGAFPSFSSLAGTPGVSAIPAGPWTFNFFTYRLSAVPSATTTLTLQVSAFHLDNSETELFLATSPPLTATTDTPLSFQYIGSAYSILVTDRLRIDWALVTLGAESVAATVTYNDPTRGSYLEMPLVLGAAGTLDHQHLNNRSQDVGAGDDACHPSGAIGPGRFHTPFDVATTAAGLLTMPDRNDCLVSGTEDLLGIATEGWMGGDKIWPTVLSPRKLKHAATVPAGFAPLYLYHNGTTPQDINFNGLHPLANGRVCLQLRTDGGITPSPCWQLIGEPTS